jgi:predicted ATP-dependent endonuclease of OLD family
LSIKSIKIKNLLSFDELIINDIKDINCIIGKNNSGKSNLLKLIRFFYNRLEDKRELPPKLNSEYSSHGSITIIYNITRIKSIVTSERVKDSILDLEDHSNSGKFKFFKHIYNVLLKKEHNSTVELTLKINSNDSIEWSISDKRILNIINYLYPFFEIDTRHIDLYDWDKLWFLISKLKSFNIEKLEKKEIIDFFDNQISNSSTEYSDYIKRIESITTTSKYSYREKVLNYVKVGLEGQTFLIDENELSTQSDGTNSHRFIEIFLNLLISLTRREYISPFVYVDEPEIGLHPKKNEVLIYNLYNIYNSFNKSKTPYPKIIFATHSPNIVKQVIKLFDKEQQILHFSKDINTNTKVQKMNSHYQDSRFLNIFNDNEARLFFSNFILFVEGETELEIFSNKELICIFPFLNDIDIYSTNDVALKYLNPAYANTSIPYLVLYDADKFIEYNFKTNKFMIRNKTLNFKKIQQAYNKSYFGSKRYYYYQMLKNTITYSNEFTAEFDRNLYLKNINLDILMHEFNIKFLNQLNIFSNKTTIEEVLINEKTLSDLYKWLIKEYLTINMDIPFSQRKKIKKNNITRIKLLRDYIKNNFMLEKDRLTLFLLIFNGKTNTLISTDNVNYKTYIDDDFKTKVDYVKKNLDPLQKYFTKTSGWATNFLNFKIRQLIKSHNKDNLIKEFKKNFEELYAIINNIKKML